MKRFLSFDFYETFICHSAYLEQKPYGGWVGLGSVGSKGAGGGGTSRVAADLHSNWLCTGWGAGWLA